MKNNYTEHFCSNFQENCSQGPKAATRRTKPVVVPLVLGKRWRVQWGGWGDGSQNFKKQLLFEGAPTTANRWGELKIHSQIIHSEII